MTRRDRLAKVLAARGMAAYAIDVRGHGGSGTRGDIGYSGQLDDDIADMAGMVRKTHPNAPIVLIGHSSGGGFALRVAGSPNQGFFQKTILLAPYLGYRGGGSRRLTSKEANMDIEAKDASAALGDIEAMTRRVRQSRVYQQASVILPVWGVLTALGYIVTFATPYHAVLTWFLIDIIGLLANAAIVPRHRGGSAYPTLEYRLAGAFVMMIAFGFLWSRGFTQMPGRALSAFWPIYFMLAYTLAGLWLGNAFIAIGLGVTATTILGFFYAGAWFDLWMAFVNGGGLILGGLWMRRS